MRYVLVDRIVSIAPRERLRAFKNVTATDALAVSSGPGMPHLPGAMLLESMAQAAGLLVIASQPVQAQPVLAKMHASPFASAPTPGDRVDMDAVLEELRSEGARLRVDASVDGHLITSAVIFLALVPVETAGQRELLASRLAALFPAWFPAPVAEASL